MTQTSKRIYEFGSFRLDAVKRLLWREDEPVPLTSKSFETLLALIERPGEILDKDELLTRIWPDTVVEEKNLTINISALRKALGENPREHRYIVTVPGRGYRFVADVQETCDAEIAQVMVQQSKMSVVVEEEEDDGETGRLGDRATESVAAGARSFLPVASSPRRRVARSFFTAIVLLAVLLAGATYWWKTKPPVSEQPGAIKTLAVLPFKALNPQGSEDYLGVGMADVMITRLSNLSQIIVRPTSSVLPFSGTDSLQAGQTLKVDSVLDGSIQQDGNRVRVTVRLLRTSDGQPLWAFQCDEQCADIFALEDTVSTRVVEALALKMTSDERKRMTQRYTENAAAYQAYLRGRYHTLQYTPDGNKQAVAELNEALRLDPAYALAWAGLADAYTAASDWLLPPREALSKARAAAEKALALDDTLAEGHAALGHVFVHQFNPAAEREFQRAMELNPNSVAAMFFYFEYFFARDADKGVAVLRRVQQLDPLSQTAGSFIASTYLMARRTDEALMEARKALELDPNDPLSREILAMVYGAKGNHAEAIAELEKVKQQLPTSMVGGGLGMEYALAGRRADALRTLAELKRMATEQYVSPFDVALVYTGLGDRDQAFAWLEKAREDQSEWMGWINSDARLDSLHSDPRFAELRRRVGLAN
jgi:DNA-binding winged helix-turn-helix (wHTH) protein/TolB-like protein